MINEDYVSLETAKLLKEKGFESDIHYFYDKNGNLLFSFGTRRYSNEYLAPTLQMAIKWLRHVHGLHIAILWDCGAYIGKNSFCYHIDDMNNYENKGWNKIGFESYEEACEAAIRYCLENLI